MNGSPVMRKAAQGMSVALAVCALALVMFGVQEVASTQLGTTQQAHAATTVVNDSQVTAKAPAAWKKNLSFATHGHISGAYHADAMLKDSSNFLMVVRLDWTAWSDSLSGLTTRAFTGVSDINDATLTWTVTRGDATVYVSVWNGPYMVWKSMHGDDSVTMTKAEAKKVLKITTGDAVTYKQVKAWGKAKAKKIGAKATKKHVMNVFVKTIALK